MVPDEIRHGYIHARHVFGRSQLVRNGNQLYYLLWQWSRKKNPHDVIYLSPKTYRVIKEILLPVKHYQEIPPNSIVYYHASSSKNYAKLKRFFKKNKLIKED